MLEGGVIGADVFSMLVLVMFGYMLLMPPLITASVEHARAPGAPPTERAVAVDAGIDHACALGENATFSCWGGGVSIDDPFIDPGRRFGDIALGENFTCALDESGEIGCWDHYQQRPLSVPAGAFDQMSIGSTHVCALFTGGTIGCWGAVTPAPGGVAYEPFPRCQRGCCAVHVSR